MHVLRVLSFLIRLPPVSANANVNKSKYLYIYVYILMNNPNKSFIFSYIRAKENLVSKYIFPKRHNPCTLNFIIYNYAYQCFLSVRMQNDNVNKSITAAVICRQKRAIGGVHTCNDQYESYKAQTHFS